ncbi:MAG TPA: hypothetical protein PLV25_06985, partial [Opitutales bacterium]|nr:hypothetical protein [Opitutales bacterium]
VLGFVSLAIGSVGLVWIAAGLNTVAIWLLWLLEQIVYQGVSIPWSTFNVSWPKYWGATVLIGLWALWLCLPPKPGTAWRFLIPPLWCLVGVLGGYLWV